MNWKEIFKRLKNPGTIVSLASLIVLILTTNGIAVDDVRVMNTIKAICSICMILGIMNDSSTPGVDGISKKK